MPGPEKINMRSLIYWNPALYNLMMRAIYGRDFQKRYKMILNEIGSMSVLDVCCGDCFLANYIDKSRYCGIDINPAFVDHGKKKGINVFLLDAARDDWPAAECVVIQASLYQFIPDHEKILNKAFQAAQKKVIISEPMYNLADSKNPLVAWIARRSTNPGAASSKERFDGDSLKMLYQKYNAVKIIDAGRELIGVFDKARSIS